MLVLGNKDNRLSPFRKCWVANSDTVIIGVFGPGTSKEISANWSSPFEGENVGNKFGKAGDVAQMVSGMTSVSTLNTRQTWEGNKPASFSLELRLYALEDPELEVMQPISALERMMAPNVKVDAGFVSAGGTPDTVILNIGTRAIYTDLVIESLSMPYEKEVDSLGRFVRATVTLQLSSLTMISKDMLDAGFGGGKDAAANVSNAAINSITNSITAGFNINGI